MTVDTPTLLSAIGMGASALFGVVRWLLGYIGDLRTDIKAQTEKIAKIADDYLAEQDAHQTTKNELAHVRNDLDILTKKHDEAQTAKTLLQSQVDSLYTRIGDIEIAFQRQSQTIDAQTKTINEQSEKINALNRKIEQLEADLFKERARVVDLQKNYKQALQEQDKIRNAKDAEITELSRQNKLKIAELNIMSQKLKDRQDEIDRLMTENDKLESQLANLRVAIHKNDEKFTERVNAMQESINALTLGVTRLMERLDKIESVEHMPDGE